VPVRQWVGSCRYHAVAWLDAQPQFVTPVLYRSGCACSRAIWDGAVVEVGKGRDSATHLMMSPLGFMQRLAQPGFRWPRLDRQELLRGIQSRQLDARIGSATTCRNADRDGRELTFTLRVQNSSVHR